MYKSASLLLVSFGSRQQECLTNLGNTVTFAVCDSFDIFLQVGTDAKGQTRIFFHLGNLSTRHKCPDPKI
jgi:hypothetical protein